MGVPLPPPVLWALEEGKALLYEEVEDMDSRNEAGIAQTMFDDREDNRGDNEEGNQGSRVVDDTDSQVAAVHTFYPEKEWQDLHPQQHFQEHSTLLQIQWNEIETPNSKEPPVNLYHRQLEHVLLAKTSPESQLNHD